LAMTRSSSREGSGAPTGSGGGTADCATAPAGAARKRTARGTKARLRIAVKTAEAPSDRLIYWILGPTLLLYTVVVRTAMIVCECDTSASSSVTSRRYLVKARPGPLLALSWFSTPRPWLAKSTLPSRDGLRVGPRGSSGTRAKQSRFSTV